MELILKIKHKIARINGSLMAYEDESSLSKYGVFSKGYLKGKLSVYENMLDDMEATL